MVRGSLRLEHKKTCPAKGHRPDSRACRCGPRVRARLAGKDYTLGSLEKGWRAADLERFERKLIDMREAIAEGASPRPHRVVVLGDYAAGWFQALHVAAQMGSISPLTFNTYEGDWRLHIGPWFGKFPLGAIDAALVNRYISAKLEAGYSRNKVMSSLTVLSGMLTDAAAESPPLIQANPMRSPRRGRHGSRRVGVQIEFEHKAPKHLEIDQAVALIEIAPDEYWDLVLCPLVTGARKQEVVAFEWDEILWGKELVDLRGQLRTLKGTGVKKVPPKYNSVRVVPLYSGFAQALGRRRRAEGYLYLTRDGTPFSESRAREVLDELYVELGLKKPDDVRRQQREERKKQGWAGISREHGLGWHALRHTYNSILAAGGVPRHVREELLGHKRRDITSRYEHMLSGAYAQVEQVLEDAFGDVVRRRLGAAPAAPRGGPAAAPVEHEPMGTHGDSPTSDFRDFRL